jgi:hypothetical protein
LFDKNLVLLLLFVCRIYAYSTACDPRWKDRLFKSIYKQEIKTDLLTMMHVKRAQLATVADSSIAAATPEIVVMLPQQIVVAPAPSHSTLYVRDFSNYILEQNNSQDEATVEEVREFSFQSQYLQEYNLYMAASCRPPNTNSLDWWRVEGQRNYPTLALIAREHLGTMCGSTQTEQLFS